MDKTILMLRDDYASRDGVTIQAFKAGTRPVFPVDVADALIAAGAAKELDGQAELDLGASAAPATPPAGATRPVAPVSPVVVNSVPPAAVAPVAPVVTQPAAPRQPTAQPAQTFGEKMKAAREAKAAAKAKAAGSLSGTMDKSLSKD